MKEISAGGVVFRKHDSGKIIQLIQDRYGKISLAKGKMEAGETIEQTALREIVEETGIEGQIIDKLVTIVYQYTSPSGVKVDKEVHYYLVEALSGNLQAQVEEIRGVEWFTPQEAWVRQTEQGYDNNNEVLSLALQKLNVKVDEQ